MKPDLRQEPLLQTEHQHILYFYVYNNWKPRAFNFNVQTKKPVSIRLKYFNLISFQQQQ